MKRKLIITSIAFIIVTFIIIVFTIVITRDDVFHVTTIKKSYNIVNTYNEEEEFDVGVYISDKKAFMVNKEKIGSAYISDVNNEERIDLEVVEVKDVNKSKEIKKKKYFLYNFKFNIDLKIDNEFSFSVNDAILNIEYPSYSEIDQGVIKLEIGSFSYTKIPYYGGINDNLIISKIKPVVNYVGQNKSLIGISLTFHNSTNDDLTIKNVELLNNVINTSNSNVKEVIEEFNSGDNISEIIGYKYDYMNSSNENKKINVLLKGKESKELLFPFVYNKIITVDNLGFVVNYEMNNEEYKIYYDDFSYFEDNAIIINDEDFIINTYENS